MERAARNQQLRNLPAEHVERVLSVMTTCGMYDAAGDEKTVLTVPTPAYAAAVNYIVGKPAVIQLFAGIGTETKRLEGELDRVQAALRGR